MSEILVIAIWDKGDDVFTRPVIVDKNTKELKFKGRKPNKLIVPESLVDKKLLKKIKLMGSFDCKVIRAVGK